MYTTRKGFLMSLLKIFVVSLLYIVAISIIFYLVNEYDTTENMTWMRTVLMINYGILLILDFLFYRSICYRLKYLDISPMFGFVSFGVSILSLIGFYFIFRRIDYPLLVIPKFLDEYIIYPLFDVAFKYYTVCNFIYVICLLILCLVKKDADFEHNNLL